jgi:hypothetical protein
MPLKTGRMLMDSMEKDPVGSSAETTSDAMRELCSRARLSEARPTSRGKVAVSRGEEPSALGLRDSLTLGAASVAAPRLSSTTIAEPAGSSRLFFRE